MIARPDTALSETDLPVPRMEAPLIRHRNQALSHLNSARTGNFGTGNLSSDQQTIQALISTLQQTMSAAAAPAPAVVAPVTPEALVEKRWVANLPTLLRYCLVDDVTDLRDVWKSIAAGPRKQERLIVQSAMNTLSASASAFTNASLNVNTDLFTTLITVHFFCGDHDKLDQGLHAYRTLYQSAAKTASDNALLAEYDQMVEISQLTLDDVGMFKRALKSHWPINFHQLDVSLKLNGNLFLLILPLLHPYLASLNRFFAEWNRIGPGLAEQFAQDGVCSPLPAQFLRSFQLMQTVYWEAINGAASTADARNIDAPDFTRLLHRFRIGDWIPPSIPGLTTRQLRENIQVLAPRAPIICDPPAPAPAPAPTPAPAPSPAPAPAAPARRTMNNGSRSDEMKEMMQGREFKLRDVTRANPPPKHMMMVASSASLIMRMDIATPIAPARHPMVPSLLMRINSSALTSMIML